MSSHRNVSARAFHPLRVLTALALSVAVLPLMAAPSYADEGATAPLDEPPCVYGDTFGEYPDPDSLTNADTTFEIDGNAVECQFDDWDGVGTKTTDELDDTTNFRGSSKEFKHPSTWVIGPSDTSADKADIQDVWVYNPEPGPGQDTYSYFAFSRGATVGTTSYDIEYNQADNTDATLPRPDRTPGDLLIQLDQQGSPGYKFVITGAWVWQLADIDGEPDNPDWNEDDCRDPKESGYDPPASWCELEDPDDHFLGAVSFEQAGWEDGEFAEGGVNLTEIFSDTTCIADFGVMNIRSRSSNSPDSALKDWVEPQSVEIQGTCQDLYIEKVDADDHTDHIGFASFEIAPDPRPGEDGDSIIVTDNVDAADIAAGDYPASQLGDEDPRAGHIKISQIEPDDYVITETVAPAGYFMAPAPEEGEPCPDVERTGPLDVNCGTLEITTGDGTVVFQDEKIWLPPTISKTASGSYGAGYDWDIEKTVSETDDEENPGDEARQDVAEGESATFYYGVTLTGTETLGGYQVIGSVTVVNPNDADMVVTLGDQLKTDIDDESGLECDFDGDDFDSATGHQVNVPPSTDGDDDEELDGTAYAYTCDDSAIDADYVVNVATVTWDLSDYPQTAEQAWAENPGVDSDSAQADVVYSVVETNKDVVVIDEYTEFGGPYDVTFGEVADNAGLEGDTYTVTWAYDTQFDDNPAGTCTEYENTAEVRLPVVEESDVNVALVPQGELLDSDTATAEACVGSNLTVTKNVVTELTRSYAYTIDKSASGTTVNVDPVTGKAIVGYTVVVTEGAATDSNWVMSGEITVVNPNDWAVTLTSISDAYPGGSCSIDPTADRLIPAENHATQTVEGQRKFTYQCTLTSQPSYTASNVATITWDPDDTYTQSGTDSASVATTVAQWESASSMTPVNRTVTIVDNKTVPGQSITLGTVTWSGAGNTTSFTYSLQLQGSAGRCIAYTNTARINETGQNDSATVTVCAPVGPSVSKTATGTYDRTYLWAIDKEADQTSVETDGTNGTEVNYTVTATPDGYVDGGWTMSGTITVSNPNDFQSMTVDIADMPNVGGGATCAVLNGDDVVVPAGTVVNGQVVPGTASRSYTCTVPQQPLYSGGTNTATITWAGGTASSAPLPVVFAVGEETDEVVTVIDDKTVQGQAIELGEATWNDADVPTVFTYSLDLEAPANECVDYVNTAEIIETGQFVDVTVEACGPEVLPDGVLVPRPRPAPEIKGVETVLPDTGGPQLGLTWAALAMLLAGGALIASGRTRRQRA